MDKIHRSQAEKIASGIRLIFEEGQRAERVISQILQSDKRMGSKDRKKIAHALFEITRWMLPMNGGIESPIYPWRILKNYLIQNNFELPPWEEFSGDNFTPVTAPHTVHSIPAWLYDFGKVQCGEHWETILLESNKLALPCLRRNTLRINDACMQRFLNSNDVHYTKLSETAYQIEAHQHLERTDAFAKGLFEFQDYHSQSIGIFCDVKPGMLVLDLCAGAGGKSLHMANLMNNQGQIVAYDIAKNKLKIINERAKRLGIRCIKTDDNPEQLKNYKTKADCVLIDAPCSGSGVLKRNPDFKWKLNLEKIKELQTTQENILQEYAEYCKIGGTLVYATCSVFPCENQEQTNKFLQKNKDRFQLLEERSFLPNTQGDGFYMAKFKRL